MAQVDALYFFLGRADGVLHAAHLGLVVYFAVKYRRRAKDETASRIHGNLKLEIAWTSSPGHRAVHLGLEREAFLHDGPPAGRARSTSTSSASHGCGSSIHHRSDTPEVKSCIAGRHVGEPR